jgi:hypothetical protein
LLPRFHFEGAGSRAPGCLMAGSVQGWPAG